MRWGVTPGAWNASCYVKGTMRCARRVMLLGTLASLLLGACLSPTLPLPPPEEPAIEELGQGRDPASREMQQVFRLAQA